MVFKQRNREVQMASCNQRTRYLRFIDNSVSSLISISDYISSVRLRRPDDRTSTITKQTPTASSTRLWVTLHTTFLGWRSRNTHLMYVGTMNEVHSLRSERSSWREPEENSNKTYQVRANKISEHYLNTPTWTVPTYAITELSDSYLGASSLSLDTVSRTRETELMQLNRGTLHEMRVF